MTYNPLTDSYEEKNYYQPDEEGYDRYCESKELEADFEREEKIRDS